MKVYIAASFERKNEVKKIQRLFVKHGHTIAADWTPHKLLAHEAKIDDLAREYAQEDVDGASSTDVFILLLGERKSVGAHIELGVALGAGVPHIYLVGKTSNPSFFYYHPKIKRVDTIEQVLRQIDGKK